jgi:hypothetical protein
LFYNTFISFLITSCTILVTILLSGVATKSYAQASISINSLTHNLKAIPKQFEDTQRHSKDSFIDTLKTIPGNLKAQAATDYKIKKQRFVNSFKSISPNAVAKSLQTNFSIKTLPITKPLIKFNGGYVAYNMNYRSNIDTPIAERNILQNSVNGSLSFAVANIPLRVNYLLRRSNSNYFRNINDVQVEFDANSYKGILQTNLKQRLLALVPDLKDSLLELDYKLRLYDLVAKQDWLKNSVNLQKIFEYKEILTLPDSIAIDSALYNNIAALKKEGSLFIDEYENRKKQFDSLSSKKDSVEKLYHKMQDNIEGYKNLIQNKLNQFKNTEQLQETLKGFGLNAIKIPAKYQRLMDVKKFGIGRNQLNYSELTSKNISLTGINFEYNSWYYVAVAAGTVDYRFRDFVVNKFNKTPQSFYMVRLGVGKLENNYFIVSTYKGQKQLFAAGASNSGVQSINIKGFSAEAKMKLAPSTYVIAEVAESLSPDFRKTPSVNQKFDLKDESNKAYSLKFYSYLPKTNSRIEAMYKYTGANFQSFSSFQTNFTVKAWSIKAEQQFFKRKLRVSASVKTNDFSNPYIIQNYKSNTVFKSIQANFRAKRFPMITLGYVPISQLTYVDSTLTENRFQSLNAGMTHFYKLGERKATSSFVYNRFYNNVADTSFAYYNAKNIFFSQQVDFSLYTMNVSASHSKSPGFELNVLDAFLNVKVGRFGLVGFGVKVHSFDKLINATGAYGSLEINMGKLGVLSAEYDNGFLPGNNHRFVKNNQMNINFIKQLN